MKIRLGVRGKLISLMCLLDKLHFKLLCFIFGFKYALLFLSKVNKSSVQNILKDNGAIIGHNCDIETGIVFHNCNNFNNLIIGNNCHIGKLCFLDLRDKIIIQDNVVISMRCNLLTHQDMSKSKLVTNFPPYSSPLILKTNSYIGASSTLLCGIVIEENTIVAAGSVVTKSFSGNRIIAGCPAREIKTIES